AHRDLPSFPTRRSSDLLYTEVADRVEDPEQRHSKLALTALSPALCSFKQRSKFLPAPLHHARRDVYLGVQNILRMQLLHHAIGHQLVVPGGAQPFGDRLERHEEAGEIFVLIERARFFFAEDAPAVLDVLIA